jgi:hypothetical protein
VEFPKVDPLKNPNANACTKVIAKDFDSTFGPLKGKDLLQKCIAYLNLSPDNVKIAAELEKSKLSPAELAEVEKVYTSAWAPLSLIVPLKIVYESHLFGVHPEEECGIGYEPLTDCIKTNSKPPRYYNRKDIYEWFESPKNIGTEKNPQMIFCDPQQLYTEVDPKTYLIEAPEISDMVKEWVDYKKKCSGK